MLTVDYDLLDIKDSERVLDLGCGEGRHSWEACKRNECLVCGLDINHTSLIKGRMVLWQLDEQGLNRGKWLLTSGSVLNLPFKDGTFDKIICSEVLEHIPDDRRSIDEIVRVLKDDGILAVSVPSYFPEAICWKISKEYHSYPGGHIRIYKAKELRSKLLDNNLDIYAVRRKHALHSFYWISRCLWGANNEKAFFPSLYHRFLVWDLKTNSKPVRMIDNMLNNFFAKSIVFYARKSHGNTG
ncbi:MAG: class I SAM-dependent methyltransferase [Dehalococcoidia bacterium]